MSVSSGPPELPPDSPGSSVSSRLQNDYNNVIRRAIVLTHQESNTTATVNPSIFGPKVKKPPSSKDRIELLSPMSLKSDVTISETDRLESERKELTQIPTLDQLLSTVEYSPNERFSSVHSSSDPISRHFHRYAELITNSLESKPINEKMDHWYLDLKKNLLSEMEKLRLKFIEEAEEIARREKQAQAKEYIRLNDDIKTMKEMLTQYEKTLDEKEQSEKNLNKALDFLYQKTLAYRRYYEWRLIHIERNQQQYALALAKRFYEEKIKRKAMINWKSFAENGWRKRFETACEQKAKTILVQLGNEFEEKKKKLEFQLAQANEELVRLREEKDEHDEALKKAFMRGVCALNVEAMSVLLNDEEQEQEPTDQEKKSNSDSEEKIPTKVYKEFLPSTIYRTGEARPCCPHARTRRVVFEQRPSTCRTRTRTRSSTINSNNVFVERHAPTNRI